MPKMRWQSHLGFVANFLFFSSAKILEIGYDSTKLQTIKRWELFETQCRSFSFYFCVRWMHSRYHKHDL